MHISIMTKTPVLISFKPVENEYTSQNTIILISVIGIYNVYLRNFKQLGSNFWCKSISRETCDAL